MPVTVHGPDGNTYQFPDGTDKAAAIAYFKKKGLGAKAAPEAPKEGFLESLGHTFGIGQQEAEARRKELKEHPIRSVAAALGGPAVQAAKGAYGGFMRTTGEAGQALDALRESNPAKAAEHAAYAIPFVGAGLQRGVEQLGPGESMNPAEVGTALGTAIQTAPMVVDAAGSIVKPIAETPRRVGEMLTKTGPHETKTLVKETQAANEAEVAKAAEKTAEQEAKRQLDLKKHFEKTQAVKAANAEGEVPAARKEALNRGVEQLDVKFKDDLEALRKKVNKEANEKYKVLNEALDPIQTDPEAMRGALADAVESIKGSSTEPTILKDISRKLEHGEPLVYEDLQGYYSELGRELTKGTLPGDIYHAYDVLQDRISDQMQRIADSQNLGPQFTDARMTWRNMKQTFYDPRSPIAKALKAGERGKAIQALSGADQTGIQALAKYDPELARRANTIRGYQAEAKGIKAGTKGLKTLPKLEPKPGPVQPEVSKIGEEEIRGAKEKGLQQRASAIRRRGEWIATGAAGYRALSNILHGNLSAVPFDLLEGGIAVGGVEGIARLLENPKVVEFLTRPTARDLAQVPAELRGDLAQVAKNAAQKGIQVDPRLYAVAGAAQPKKRVAAALTP